MFVKPARGYSSVVIRAFFHFYVWTRRHIRIFFFFFLVLAYCLNFSRLNLRGEHQVRKVRFERLFIFCFPARSIHRFFFLLLNIIHPIEASEQESSSKTGQILDHRQTLMFVQRDAPCGRMRGERNHNRTRSLFFWSVWNQGYPADKEMTWQQQSFFLLFFFWANQPSLVMRHVAVL